MNHALRHSSATSAHVGRPGEPTEAERRELYRARPEYLSGHVFRLRFESVPGSRGEDEHGHEQRRLRRAIAGRIRLRTPLELDRRRCERTRGAWRAFDVIVLEPAVRGEDPDWRWRNLCRSMTSQQPGISMERPMAFGESLRKSRQALFMQKSQLRPRSSSSRDVLQLLKPETGRMAIVMPNGILNNPALAYLRYWILDTCGYCSAVVDMNRDLFSRSANDTQTSPCSSCRRLRQRGNRARSDEAVSITRSSWRWPRRLATTSGVTPIYRRNGRRIRRCSP